MRSRSSSLEDVTKVKLAREEVSGRPERRGRHREPPDDTGTIQRNHKSTKDSGSAAAKGGRKEKTRDLSRDDMVFLLSLLEGELQARDEVITVLKAEKIDMALLEAKYGFVTPPKVLQALQRDAIQGKADGLQEDIYERPMMELDNLVEKQRETYRRMLEQLLMVEQAHKQALHKMADEKRNHGDFMKKSDEFTNLLEQERERLKLLIDQERAYQERKDQENNKKVTSLKEELTKVKSFALMVVDEQQRLNEQLNQQTAKVQQLSTTASQVQEELTLANANLREEEQKVSRLEAELRDCIGRHHQEQETVMAKLTSEDAQNRQLRHKLSTLSRQLDELEDTNKTLRRAEEELLEMRDKMSRGECGNSGFMSELEELRKRVLEMEGKDEELIRMEDHCRDLNKKLEKEASQSYSLKAEVDKLNQRIMDLEKLEGAFSESKEECNSLKRNLEREKTVSKTLSGELEALKAQVKDLECAEGQLEKTELTLKEDLTKLKTLTVMLVDERKTMAEKLKQMENKVQNSSGKLQAEQEKVTTVTEKLIEESKKALRSKAELEQKMCEAKRERDDLKGKLRDQEEKNMDLESKINLMKKRLQSLETIERDYLRSKVKEEHVKTPLANRFQQEDNKVKDLTQEVERLRRKLKDIRVGDSELLKTDELESLEKKFTNEQEKAQALMKELEMSRKELSTYQLAEKNDSNQEHVLFKRLKEEEARSSHLTQEVAALKEKIHEYMGQEESICHMKTDQASLRRKLTQQEIRNKELAREMETLTRELERYRRFSKSLRPGMNGRRFSDLHLATKEVQTDPDDLTTTVPLERAVLNGKLCGEGDSEDNEVYKRGPSLVNNINNLNNSMRRVSNELNSKFRARPNGNHVQAGDVVLTHNPGQPLQIKVTPEHGHNMATLEITSPNAENTPSFTSTAIIPTSGAPPKQRITIIQNAAISPRGSPISHSPDRMLSPLTMATYSRTLSPDSSSSTTPERAVSPIQIVSVTTTTPDRNISSEPAEVAGGHAVFRVTPERQNGWQVQRSNSSGSNIITTEDNKIHIHLGGAFNSAAAQEQRIANGGVATPKSKNKITSSIMIKPAATQSQRPSQITIPQESFRRPGPTRIPKPKGFTSVKGTSGNGALQIRSQSLHTPLSSGKVQAVLTSAAAHRTNNNNPNLANRRL
ncbi:filamin A-interacting protein 1-like isoform X2 [Syngnathus scovelli]|nr:filamin A-interacting protein 1-like isoform X2 [Syngnathus scovelli]